MSAVLRACGEVGELTDQSKVGDLFTRPATATIWLALRACGVVLTFSIGGIAHRGAQGPQFRCIILNLSVCNAAAARVGDALIGGYAQSNQRYTDSKLELTLQDTVVFTGARA